MYILSSPFFTWCPSRHGPSVMIKLPVVCQASTLLMISIYLTIILASNQGILVGLLARNSRAIHVYSTRKFYLVAELYCIKAEQLCYTTWLINWNLYIHTHMYIWRFIAFNDTQEHLTRRSPCRHGTHWWWCSYIMYMKQYWKVNTLILNYINTYACTLSISKYTCYVRSRQIQSMQEYNMYSCAVTTYVYTYVCVTITALHRPPTFVYTTTTAIHGYVYAIDMKLWKEY